VTSSSSTNESSELGVGVGVESPRSSTGKGRRVRRRKAGVGLASRAAVVLCASVVVAAPLAVGGVHRGTLIGFMLAAGLALALLAVGAVVDRRPLRVGLAVMLPAVLVLIPALQSLPLPLALRGLLDPAGNAFLTDNALAPHATWPLSLDPTSTREFLGKAAAALAVFLCAFHLASGQTRRHVIARALAGAGIAAVAIGLGHRLFGVLSIYGHFATIPRSLLVGPFVNPNHNAEFLELGAFACLACAFQRSSALNRYAWLTGMLFCAAGAIATFSRAAVLAVFVGMAAFTALRIFRRDGTETEGRRASLVWSLLIVALVGVIALVLGAGALIERFHRDSITADVRVGLWADGWKVLRAHPLGIGRGAFDRVFPIYRTLVVPFPIRFTFIENHPYQLLIDSGWLGFAAILAAAAFVARTVIRRGRRDTTEAAFLAGLLAVVAHSLTDFGLETLGVLLPFAAMLGTVLGRCHQEEPEKRPWRSRLAVGLAMAGVVVGTGSLALASSDNFDVLLKNARGVEQARRISTRAQEVHPADYFYVLSYANTQPLRGPPGSPSPRLHALNRALLRCPSCDIVHVGVARSLWQMRRRGQAVVEWRTAVQLEPGLFPHALIELYNAGATPEEMAAVASFDARKMVEVADFLAVRSHVKEAIAVLDQADAVDVPRVDSLVTRVRLVLENGQVEAAQTALAQVHAAGLLDPRVSVLDARVGLAVRGKAGADDALATLDAAAARYPLDVDVQRQRLALVTQFEKWQVADRAVEGLKVALYHAYGQASEAHLAAARIQARLRRWNQSFGEYRIALIADPSNGQLWFEFGRTAEEAGRYPVAREAYSEAVRALPNDPIMLEAIRRLDRELNLARSGRTAGPAPGSEPTPWKEPASP
jgi:tetratricopeptide (TPR) repeat protein